MEFCIEAYAQFTADNIQDALTKLADHFLKVKEDTESNLLESGYIDVEPVDEEAEEEGE